jgi:hypothetical protein
LCAALLGGFLIWGALHENSRFLVKAQSFRSGKKYLLLAPIHNRLLVILPATHGASASAKRKRNPTSRSASSDHIQWN